MTHNAPIFTTDSKGNAYYRIAFDRRRMWVVKLSERTPDAGPFAGHTVCVYRRLDKQGNALDEMVVTAKANTTETPAQYNAHYGELEIQL